MHINCKSQATRPREKDEWVFEVTRQNEADSIMVGYLRARKSEKKETEWDDITSTNLKARLYEYQENEIIFRYINTRNIKNANEPRKSKSHRHKFMWVAEEEDELQMRTKTNWFNKGKSKNMTSSINPDLYLCYNSFWNNLLKRSGAVRD